MKISAIYKNASFYKKLLISFILLVVITVALVSTILYKLFSDSAVSEISKMSHSMLQQTSYASDVIYNQTFSVANQLLGNNQVITAMIGSENDPVNEYHVRLIFNNIQGVYSFINNIIVYNGNTEDAFGSDFLSDSQYQDIIENIESNSEERVFEFMPKVLHSDENSSPQNVLTFIFYSNYLRTLPSKSALIVNINESFINDTIKELANSPEDILYVIDEKGTVLSHSDKSQFTEDFSKYDYVKEILNSKSPSGELSGGINSNQYMINYVKSEDLGWIFVSMKPYSKLLTNIYRLRMIIIIVSSLLILIIAALSIGITGKLYNPLRLLMNKMSSVNPASKSTEPKRNEYEFISEAFENTLNKANVLERSMDSAKTLLSETYLSFLLKGMNEKASEVKTIISNLDNQLESPFFCVLVLKIDDIDSVFHDSSLKEQRLTSFAINKICKEALDETYTCHTVSVEYNHTAVLLLIREATIRSNLKSLLKSIQKTISQQLEISVSIGIGNIVSVKGYIHSSYESALECTDYRLYRGYGCILDYEEVKNYIVDESKYPYSTEKKLIDALQLGKHSRADNAADEFISYAASISINNVYVYFNQLLLAINKQFENIVSTLYGNHGSYFDVINSSLKIETLEKMAIFLKNLCYDIIDATEARNNNRYVQMMDKVKSYILDNYQNPNLSLEYISDKVHLSPGYVGKLFRDETNMFVNDYINKVRMEKAREMLQETDEPASVISEKIGILNTSYFFTLFKKAYGKTPSQYRIES